MRILLAEDERDLNEIIVRKLTAEGYSVDACFDGEEAAGILSYTDYDAVILDIMMPGADGFSVLRRLRDGADLNANPGQVAGWLCAGMFLRP